MNRSIASIVDLPDELLVHILKKLTNFDVLYSLVDVNEKLNRITCDVSFSRVADLMTTESHRMMSDSASDNATLDRFCMEILPRIHDHVGSLTVQARFLPRILHVTNYRSLRKLVIMNLELTIACKIFNEKSPWIHIFQEQISELVLMISDNIMAEPTGKLLTHIYNGIFGLVTNLKCLEFDVDESCTFSQSLLTGLPSTTCCSSSIVHLRIKAHNIDDCLCLLDGRLSQLHVH